jgi:alpha-tubulin suppressor-like RCC1 family protein
MSIKCALASVVALLAVLVLGPGVASAVQGGVLYDSGYNGYGELGDGLAVGYYIPQAGTGLSNVTAVSSGYYATLALLSSGSVDAWGYNEYGEVGDGTKTKRESPVSVSGLSGVTAVAAGEYHSLALLANGTVEAWGYNGYGELGDNGAVAESETPGVVPGLAGVTAIAASCDASYALLANGTVDAWGYNEYGELGDGTKTERKAPVPVAGLENVVAISAGCDFAMALLKNGTVEAWGYGNYGELGTGNAKEQLTPEPVPGVSGATSIAAGGYFGLALLGNGTIEGWGYNGEGELGDGSKVEDRTPELVPGVSNVAAISTGGYYSLALLANGTVEGWGYNDDGELGDGTYAARSTHEQLTYPAAATGLGSGGGGDSYSSFVIEGAVASVSSSSLTFPAQNAGTTSPAQSVVVSNAGPASLSISGDSLAGAGAGAFHKTFDSCQGATLAAGATCSIAYTFAPSAAGSAAATLTVSSTALKPLPTVSLSGTGLALVAPSLSALDLSSSAFVAAHSGASAVAASVSTGTFVVYTDSQAATSTFTVEQQLHGVVGGSGRTKRCGTAPKHVKKGAKRCTFYKPLGSFANADVAGTNALRFSGRVAGRTLALGTYRLSASAHSAGGTSATRTAAFKITR